MKGWVGRGLALLGLVLLGLALGLFFGWKLMLRQGSDIAELADRVKRPWQKPHVTEQAAEQAARQALDLALDAYSSAPDEASAARKVRPMLEELWDQWPNTKAAVQARLFDATTVRKGDGGSKASAEEAGFLRAALGRPELYFSAEHGNSSLAIAGRVIEDLERAGDRAGAWDLCLELRRSSPRVGPIVPLCRRIATHEVGRVSRWLATPGQRTVLNPYDTESLAEVIFELRSVSAAQEGESPGLNPMALRSVSDALEGELLEMDPAAAAALESRLAALDPPPYPGFRFPP